MQVESCVRSDSRRVEVALTRSEPDIATFLMSETKKRGSFTWDEIKGIMKKQFLGVTASCTLLQAWQEITAISYLKDEPPSSFLNKLQCKIAAVRMRFPNKSVPSSEKFLKMKISNGLHPTSQAILDDFLADDVPLEEFMLLAEEEYYRGQGKYLGQKERLLPLSGKRNPQTPPSIAPANPVESPQKEVECLTKQLEELKKEIQNVNPQNPKK